MKLFFGVFPSDKALCVVRYLRQYVERMVVLGGTDARLFISLYLPHKEVGWGTVRCWKKMGFQKAGVDMSIFMPHSTRAASTSKAV